MAASRVPVLCLVLVSFFILLLLRSRPLGFNEIVFWAGRLILILALATLAISFLSPLFNTLTLTPHSTTVPKHETERHKEMARLGQQECLNKKEAEDSASNLDIGNSDIETANEEEIRKRKLPDHVTKPVAKVEQPQPKKVITLPEEPNELDEGVVTIALRCPSGRMYKRRFYKDCTSFVLHDWMLKIGYHPTVYEICIPFPRSSLEPRQDLTLENIGITKHTVLNVDKKDDI